MALTYRILTRMVEPSPMSLSSVAFTFSQILFGKPRIGILASPTVGGNQSKGQKIEFHTEEMTAGNHSMTFPKRLWRFTEICAEPPLESIYCCQRRVVNLFHYNNNWGYSGRQKA